MSIIQFAERARLIRLQREFHTVSKSLRETRTLLEYPLSSDRRAVVMRQRRSAIRRRDRLEKAFDQTEEGTERKRILLGNLSLEDLG